MRCQLRSVWRSASVARRLAVLAAFRGTVVHATFRITRDRLVAAIRAIGKDHAMALAHQRAHGLVREAGLEVHFTAVGHRGVLASGLGGPVVLDARRVTGLLQVHAEVEHVDQDLHVTLRLHRAAHHAEAQPRLAVLRGERGNDGVERTLARRVAVGMVLAQHELLAAVLQDEAQARRRHAAAHAAVVGLDQRDHHAVGVGGGEVDRVAFVELRGRARLHFAQRGVHRDQRAAFAGVVLGDQPLDGRGMERGIGVPARAVGERQLLGLDEQMHMLGAAEAVGLQIVGFEQVEDLQRGDALPARRQFPQLDAAITRRHRFDPVAGVRGHVLVGEEPVVRGEVIADHARDVARVERVAATVSDRLQRVREIRVAPGLAGARRATVDGELLGEARPLAQSRHRTVPVVGDHLGHRVPFAGVTDGRRQVVGHRLATETVVQGEPAVDRSGHRHRQRAGGRDVLQAAALELSQGERFRRAARTVVAIELLRLRVPDDGEQVATDAVAGRLHQAERGIGRDRRVDCRASALHHVQRDLGGQRLRGSRHRMRGDHLRTGREGVAGDAVGGRCGGRHRDTGQGDGEQGRKQTGHDGGSGTAGRTQ